MTMAKTDVKEPDRRDNQRGLSFGAQRLSPCFFNPSSPVLTAAPRKRRRCRPTPANSFMNARLWCKAAGDARRLLRVLLLWLGTLSADPGRAFGRDRSVSRLSGLSHGRRFRPILTRLAWQCPHQPVDARQ